MTQELNTETGYTQVQVETFLNSQEETDGKWQMGYDEKGRWHIKQNGYEFKCKESGTKELFYFIGKR
jgi:hypothetical protein